MSSNVVKICMSANDSIVIYLDVAIKSLSVNCKKSVYELYILYRNIDYQNQILLKKNESDKLKIFFINVEKYNYSNLLNKFKVDRHLPIESYFRLFIPYIFDFDKIIYIDVDVVILNDIEELWRLNLNNYLVAACRDFGVEDRTLVNTDIVNYLSKKFSIDLNDYFNSGLMVLNLALIRKEKVLKKIINNIEILKQTVFADQDILNYLFKGSVLFLPLEWNFLNHIKILDNSFDKHLTKEQVDLYLLSRKNAKLIHFCGYNLKPLDLPFSREVDLFFKYAVNSSYKNRIIIYLLKKIFVCVFTCNKKIKYYLFNLIIFIKKISTY